MQKKLCDRLIYFFITWEHVLLFSPIYLAILALHLCTSISVILKEGHLRLYWKLSLVYFFIDFTVTKHILAEKSYCLPPCEVPTAHGRNCLSTLYRSVHLFGRPANDKEEPGENTENKYTSVITDLSIHRG